MGRRTEITIEAQRLLMISRRRVTAVTWCEQCAERVSFVGADEAAALCGVTPRAIYRWVDENQLHFVETPEGLLLLCLGSLPRPQVIDQARALND
ncbi:MAG TPA: hypothetical protein VE961_04735 [Pyrinomonadaceae bacterium]|nr:hypothetical protein [Pyrinomonadaceae bacterium]